MAELLRDEKENSDWFLSGPNFAKMDYLPINFGELHFQFIAQKKQFSC